MEAVTETTSEAGGEGASVVAITVGRMGGVGRTWVCSNRST